MHAPRIHADQKKRISIFGASGSIGQSTLSLVRDHPDQFEVSVLTAGNNVQELIKLAIEFKPDVAVIGNEAHFEALKDALAGSGIDVAAGDKAICDAARRPADIVMMAIVGAVSLQPTMCAIQAGHTIAFASKECLVCAGSLVTDACRKYGATLLPVDSEHNAVFQVFDFQHPESIDKITLTASGGPFRNFSIEQMQTVTPAQALAHPNWSMGAKISVDSATMMNKALEVIEAFHLFPLSSKQIEVVIHPESIIHSFVHYRDGSVLAQLGMPDMRIPIAHTLAWPNRLRTANPTLNLAKAGSLTFEAPDETRFPALRMVKTVLDSAPGAAIAFNAANEVAVQAFLDERISYCDISNLVENVLQDYLHSTISSLEEVLYLNDKVRKVATEIISKT